MNQRLLRNDKIRSFEMNKKHHLLVSAQMTACSSFMLFFSLCNNKK